MAPGRNPSGIEGPAADKKDHDKKHVQENRRIDTALDCNRAPVKFGRKTLFLDKFFNADTDPDEIKNDECFGKKVNHDGQKRKRGVIRLEDKKLKIALQAADKEHEKRECRKKVTRYHEKPH